MQCRANYFCILCTANEPLKRESNVTIDCKQRRLLHCRCIYLTYTSIYRKINLFIETHRSSLLYKLFQRQNLKRKSTFICFSIKNGMFTNHLKLELKLCKQFYQFCTSLQSIHVHSNPLQANVLYTAATILRQRIARPALLTFYITIIYMAILWQLNRTQHDLGFQIWF